MLINSTQTVHFLFVIIIATIAASGTALAQQDAPPNSSQSKPAVPQSFAAGRPVWYENCEWSQWVNSYDGKFVYLCPGRKFVGGVQSIHNNHHEDRIFSFYCCDLYVGN